MAEQGFEADPLNIKKEIDQELLLLEKTFDSKLEELYRSAENSLTVPPAEQVSVITRTSNSVQPIGANVPATQPIIEKINENHDEAINQTKSASTVPRTPPREDSDRIKTEPPSPTNLCSTNLVDKSVGLQTNAEIAANGTENDNIDDVFIKPEPPSPLISPVKANTGSIADIDIKLPKEEIKDEFDSDYELYEIEKEDGFLASGSEQSNQGILSNLYEISDSTNNEAEPNISQIEINASITNKQANPGFRKRKPSPKTVAVDEASNSKCPRLQNYNDQPLGVLLNLVDPKKWKSKSTLNSPDTQNITNNERNNTKTNSRQNSGQESNEIDTTSGNNNIKPARKLRSGRNVDIVSKEPAFGSSKRKARASDRLSKGTNKSITSSDEDEIAIKRTRGRRATKKDFTPHIISSPVKSNIKSILKKTSSKSDDRIKATDPQCGSNKGRCSKKREVHFAGIESDNDICDDAAISNEICLGAPVDNTLAPLNNLPDVVKDSFLAGQITLPLPNKYDASKLPSDSMNQTDKMTASLTKSFSSKKSTTSNAKNKITDYYTVKDKEKQDTLLENKKNSKERKLSEASNNEVNVDLESEVGAKMDRRKHKEDLKVTSKELKVTERNEKSAVESKAARKKQKAGPKVTSAESVVEPDATLTQPKGAKKSLKVESTFSVEGPKVSRQKRKIDPNKTCEDPVDKLAVNIKKIKNKRKTSLEKPELCVKSNIDEPAVACEGPEVLNKEKNKQEINKSEVAQKSNSKKYAFARKSTGPVLNIAESNQQTESKSVPEYSENKSAEKSQNLRVIKKGYARKSTGPVGDVRAGQSAAGYSEADQTPSSSQVKGPVLAYLCICGEWCKTDELLSGHLKYCKKLQPKIQIPKVKIPL